METLKNSEEISSHFSSKKKNLFTLHKKKLISLFVTLLLGVLIALALFLTSSQQKLPKLAEIPILKEKAPVAIQEIVATAVQPELLPASYSAQPTKNNPGDITDPYRYTLFWTSVGGPAEAAVLYDSSYEPSVTNILFSLPNQPVRLTASDAANLSTSYFQIRPRDKWQCAFVKSEGTQGTLCENFWIDNRIKKGIAVLTTPPSVFYCQIYPSSSMYIWKSCSSLKAMEGWE